MAKMPEGYDVAVRLLSRREHSAHQLRQKLELRDFSADAIDVVLEKCLQLDLQSDARFAEMFCRGRINRGYGPLVIRQLLRQAGVSAELSDAALEQAEVSLNWQDEVSRVWHKKYRGVADNISPQAQHKQRQFLSYRGFPEASIKQFFEQFIQTRCHHEIDE
ncbi:MAG: regulatory protein RecX [Legionella sp.]|nr:regulatory protein RecX [Legionella sp.]